MNITKFQINIFINLQTASSGFECLLSLSVLSELNCANDT